MRDMRDVYTERKTDLEVILGTGKVSAEQKRFMSIAMAFGYAAAFSSRTCDMNGSFFQAQTYQDGYEAMMKRLGKK